LNADKTNFVNCLNLSAGRQTLASAGCRHLQRCSMSSPRGEQDGFAPCDEMFEIVKCVSLCAPCHRTKRSKGCLTRDGMLHMMFKLGQCAQKNWRRQRGFNYLAKVITGVKFRDGIEVTESNQAAA
jgi:hypothetical protein